MFTRFEHFSLFPVTFFPHFSPFPSNILEIILSHLKVHCRYILTSPWTGIFYV